MAASEALLEFPLECVFFTNEKEGTRGRKEKKTERKSERKQNRKWAESQDLTPYLKRLQAEKEGVSVHESEDDRNSEGVSTESVIERGESSGR